MKDEQRDRGWCNIDTPSYSQGKWWAGIGAFLGLCAYGIKIISKGEAVWRGRRYSNFIILHGTDAILFGTLFVCAGLFLHFRYFWGNTKRLEHYHHAGETLSALVFVCVIITLLWRECASWV